jgi:hypothetical protein
MKPMLSLLLCMLFLQGHAQDSMPKRLLKYKISVIEWNGAKQTGYLGYINDSILYVSTTQVAVNQPAQHISQRRALDFSQIRWVHLKRKGSVGRGILIGAISGLAAGAIAGLISGDDPSCQRSYASDPNQYNIFSGFSYSMCTAFSISAGEKAVIGGTLGMISGGLIGGIIGAVARKKFIINGSKEKFNAMQLTVLERVYGKSTSQNP